MYYYIINPAAGNRSIDDIQPKLKTALSRLNIEGEFVKTIGAGDAAKLTQRAIDQGYKTIVAVGGDQTVDEVAIAAYRSARPVAVGIIPTGQSNTLAERLGVTSWKQAGQALAARRLVKVQLIEVNGKTFIHQLNIPATGAASGGTSRPRPLKFQLQADSKLEATGAAQHLSVTNQRLHELAAPNRLVIKIASADRKPAGWLARLGLSDTNRGHTSQLHAHELALSLKEPAEATCDHAQLMNDRFDVKLTDSNVAFVCRRAKAS